MLMNFITILVIKNLPISERHDEQKYLIFLKFTIADMDDVTQHSKKSVR